MKKAVFIFLILFPLGIMAQEWAAAGTKWYYTQSLWVPGYRFPRIFDAMGQLLIKLEHHFENEIDVKSLNSGIYIIEITLNSHHRYNLKFIKN